MENRQETIEGRVSVRLRRQKIQNIVLRSIYASTALGMAMVAPNSVQLLKYVEKYIGPKQKLDRRVNQAVARLVEKKLLTRSIKGERVSLELTEKGKNLSALLEQHQKSSVPKPKKWDGRWRIIIFDIWEKRRSTRDRLRIILARAGFVKVQNSVWVYPYPCEELFVFVRMELKLGKGVLYIVAEEIEYDVNLRKHFKLKT